MHHLMMQGKTPLGGIFDLLRQYKAGYFRAAPQEYLGATEYIAHYLTNSCFGPALASLDCLTGGGTFLPCRRAFYVEGL